MIADLLGDVLASRDLAVQADDRGEMRAGVLLVVMAATEHLAVLVVEPVASAATRDDLIDVERTGAAAEDREDAAAISLMDSLADVATLSLLGSTLARDASQRRATERRVGPAERLAAYHRLPTWSWRC